MKLAKASTWFVKTPVDGWNGSSWVAGATLVDFLPHDRFISEREFGNKRRYVLCAADDTALETYKVIRFAGPDEIYLVGTRNFDIQVDPYSRLYLLHRADYLGTLYQFSKTTSASGLPGSVSRQSLGTFHCDIERVTFSSSQELENTKFTEYTLTLPAATVIETDYELKIGTDYYAIREVYTASRFSQCRATRKKSA